MLAQMKQTDIGYLLTYIIEDDDFNPVDLTGASATFIMGKKNKLLINSPAIITDPVNGVVEYEFTSQNALVSGNFLGEFRVTFQDGDEIIYPRNGYITVNIQQNIDTNMPNIMLDAIAERQGEFSEKLDSILMQAGNLTMTSMNEYAWEAEEGQLTYVIPSDDYDPSTKWFQVYVDNIPVDPKLINRNTDGQFTLDIDPLIIEQGMGVIARWTQPIGAYSQEYHYAQNEAEWEATEGQLVYTMPEGVTYDPDAKSLEVSVGGIVIAASDVQKDNDSQFTLLLDSSDVPSGVKVLARWVEPYAPVVSGHKKVHEKGGYDEIDIAKLKNYEELVASPLADTTSYVYAEEFKRVPPEIDDTGRLQRAIDKSVEVGKSLFLNQGTYTISSPLKINKTLDPLTPIEGFTILGVVGVPKYNSHVMPSMIVASSSFPTNESMFDFRYTTCTTVKSLGLLGKSDINGIELGTRTGTNMFSNHKIEDCTIHDFYDGIKMRNSGILKIYRNNISMCSHTGIGLLEFCGDSDLEGNFINTNNVDYVGTDDYTGSGILVASSNNVNIRGGKVEWNAKGIVVYGSSGVNISAINFDVNKHYHIHIKPVNNSDKACRGITITGCRFLSGGSYANGAIGKTHILVSSDVNTSVIGVISGNSFRKGGTGAYDLNTIGTVSPSLYGLRIESNGEVKLLVNGNDMYECSNVSSIGASGVNVVVTVSGNIANLPNEVYNGATIS